MIFRSPLGFAIALFLGFSVGAVVFLYYAVSYDMAMEPLIAGSFFLLAALLVIKDLRRYRADDHGLVIQHLLTRQKRVIPYTAMREISTSYTRRARRYAPRTEEVHVRHARGTVIVPFFDAHERDAFAEELERGRELALQQPESEAAES